MLNKIVLDQEWGMKIKKQKTNKKQTYFSFIELKIFLVLEVIGGLNVPKVFWPTAELLE